VAIVAVGLFLENQPPVEITVAVNPLAEAWMQQAARGFNDSDTRLSSNRRVRVNVVVVEDVGVWQTSADRVWTPEDHPAAWLPAASVSVSYARSANLPFEIVQPSTARTPIIFGGMLVVLTL